MRGHLGLLSLPLPVSGRQAVPWDLLASPFHQGALELQASERFSLKIEVVTLLRTDAES